MYVALFVYTFLSSNESTILGFREHFVPDLPLRMRSRRRNFWRDKLSDRAEFRTSECSDDLLSERLSRRRLLHLM